MKCKKCKHEKIFHLTDGCCFGLSDEDRKIKCDCKKEYAFQYDKEEMKDLRR